MHFFYNLLVSLVEKLLPVTGHFSEKMSLFVKGRKDVFSVLEHSISLEDKVIWVHAASLGEYEQAVPVIGELKKMLPEHKILVTFFSPSGYEVKKNSSLADVITYLPLDTARNARKFLDRTHPELALFVKYEFWPNFLQELKERKVNTLLISGSFRKDQVFFKSYGRWMWSYLMTFDHFFVQNKVSQNLLEFIGFYNVSISGDTRFDRVSDQLKQNNYLDFIEEFKGQNLCLVAGSTWPEDEKILVDAINNSSKVPKIIIAPHALKSGNISSLRKRLKVKTVLYSEREDKNLADFHVFIIDTIGLLTKIYNYADVAYVGGAVGETGLHNVLEPATFGVPVITGNNISKFPEAEDLQRIGGLFTVSSSDELKEQLERLFESKELRRNSGEIAGNFVKKHSGATRVIIGYLEERYSEKS